jgi:hypothetical protein
MAYRVTCPLVVAKDREGRNHHCYQGAVIHWLPAEQVERWLRLGLVEEIDVPEAPQAPVAQPAPAIDPGRPTGGTKPAKTASDEAWIEFGVGQGHDRDELTKLSKAELREFLG